MTVSVACPKVWVAVASLRKAALEASGLQSLQAPHSDPGPGSGEWAGGIRSALEESGGDSGPSYIWTATASLSGEVGPLGGLGGAGMAI